MSIRRIRTDKTTITNGSYTVNYNGKNTISRKSLVDMEKQIDQFLDQYDEWSKRFDDPRYYGGSQNSFNIIREPDSSDGGYDNLNTETGCKFVSVVKKVSASDNVATVKYNYPSLPDASKLVLSNTERLIVNTYIVDLNLPDTYGATYIEANYCFKTDNLPNVYDCQSIEGNSFGLPYSPDQIVGGPFPTGIGCDNFCENTAESINNEIPETKYATCEFYDPLEDGLYIVIAINYDQINSDFPLTRATTSVEPYLIAVENGFVRYRSELLAGSDGLQDCWYFDSNSQSCQNEPYETTILHLLTQQSFGHAGTHYLTPEQEQASNANISYVEYVVLNNILGADFIQTVRAELCDDYCYFTSPLNQITIEDQPNDTSPGVLCNMDCWPVSFGSQYYCQNVSNNLENFDPCL